MSGSESNRRSKPGGMQLGGRQRRMRQENERRELTGGSASEEGGSYRHAATEWAKESRGEQGGW